MTCLVSLIRIKQLFLFAIYLQLMLHFSFSEGEKKWLWDEYKQLCRVTDNQR